MYLYTNEKAQKTAFLPIDVQKRRRRRYKKELFANYSASNYNTIVLQKGQTEVGSSSLCSNLDR